MFRGRRACLYRCFVRSHLDSGDLCGRGAIRLETGGNRLPFPKNRRKMYENDQAGTASPFDRGGRTRGGPRGIAHRAATLPRQTAARARPDRSAALPGKRPDRAGPRPAGTPSGLSRPRRMTPILSPFRPPSVERLHFPPRLNPPDRMAETTGNHRTLDHGGTTRTVNIHRMRARCLHDFPPLADLARASRVTWHLQSADDLAGFAGSYVSSRICVRQNGDTFKSTYAANRISPLRPTRAAPAHNDQNAPERPRS